jgi:hypothetical protein
VLRKSCADVAWVSTEDIPFWWNDALERWAVTYKNKVGQTAGWLFHQTL